MIDEDSKTSVGTNDSKFQGILERNVCGPLQIQEFLIDERENMPSNELGAKPAQLTLIKINASDE